MGQAYTILIPAMQRAYLIVISVVFWHTGTQAHAQRHTHTDTQCDTCLLALWLVKFVID